jgi:hypothetical protein
MENRFLETDSYRKPVARQSSRRLEARSASAYASANGQGVSRAKSVFARSFTADQRALVILIENGGVDLGIPELADKLLAMLPGASMLPESARQKLIVFLRDTIKGFTDTLLESAELAVNRYSSASPEHFGSVSVMRNGTATYTDLKDKLISLSKDGKLIDILVLTHGNADVIAVNGDVTGAKIKQMRAEYGKPLSIRTVYMMNCVGSSLNQAWIDAGAKVSSGAIRNNYLPEPTTFFFWQAWKAGQNFETAVTLAYRKTINAMNDAVRGFIASLLGPLGGMAAGEIDFENMDFVKDSAPVIQGQRTVSISSDDLVFTQSMSSSLATTVLPVHMLQAMSLSRSASLSRVEVSHSHSYHSPSTTMAWREDYSRMQNPAAVIAGIAVADAVQIGLAAVAIVQTQVNASGGSFQLSYDKAHRLLTPEARTKMPGSQMSKSNYKRDLLGIGKALDASDEIRDHFGWVEANVVIEWEGNPYGEIGTPVFSRNLRTSTDWSKSSAAVVITKLDRIPLSGLDPRAWPILFKYDGHFDPVGNGHWEFTGEFEINAFGGLKFNKHEVVSRSAIEFAIGKPEDYVRKGKDIVVPIQPIPQEQVNYLKANMPL